MRVVVHAGRRNGWGPCLDRWFNLLLRAELELARLVADSRNVGISVVSALDNKVYFIIVVVPVFCGVQIPVRSPYNTLGDAKSQCPDGAAGERIVMWNGAVEIVAKYFPSEFFHILSNARIQFVVVVVAIAIGDKDGTIGSKGRS